MAYDEIMSFPHHFKDYFHPEKLHQINVSFAVSDLAKHLGGITTNIAYALRNTVDYYGHERLDSRLRGNDRKNLGDDKQNSKDEKITIYPVAAVGRDGGELLDFFKVNKIDTKYVQQDAKLYTATGKVITDKNDNQIWGFYYGAARLNPKLETLNPKQIRISQSEKSDSSLDSRLRGNDASFREFWIVSATHEKPFSTVLKFVIKNELPYLFDPGMTLTWIRDDLLKKGVLNSTFLVGNDYEIAMIEKRIKMSVREIVESGVNVITTLGVKGVKYEGCVIPVKTGIQGNRIDSPLRVQARLRGNDKRSEIDKERGIDDGNGNDEQITTQIVKAVRVKKMVDPTGAGDAWRGGFVGALAAGKSIGECLVMGNVMASFSVECVGTVEYKVTDGEIEKRVKSITK